jgi:acylphosphatase
MLLKRAHVFYSGYVQGVGFRYTARNIASLLRLTGWVKNLRDGRVEVVCEGEEKKLKKFLEDIKDEFHGRYITDAQIEWEEPTNEFDRFEIVF